MSETSDKLLNIIQEKDISYGELSTMTGIPKSILHRYATGRTKKIPVDRLVVIAKALNVDPYSISDFDTATEMLSSRIEQREYAINNPPTGLTKRDIEVAFEYHDLDERGKHIIDTFLIAERDSLLEELSKAQFDEMHKGE